MAPRNLKGVRALLGLTNYYKKFIQNYSQLVEPLTRLTRKNTPFKWISEQQEVLETLKEKLSSEPILVPLDYTKKFILHIDASNKAIGGILAQLDHDGKEHVVKYLHWTFSQTKRNYSATDREATAAL